MGRGRLPSGRGRRALLVEGQDASFQNKTHLALKAAGFGEVSSA